MRYRHELRTYLAAGTGALLMVAAVVFQAEAERIIYTPPFAGGCQEKDEDVTKKFNDWLANKVPDNAVIRLAHNRCYKVNGTIEFNNKHDIIIRGNNATIKATGEAPCPYAGMELNAQGYCVIPSSWSVPGGSGDPLAETTCAFLGPNTLQCQDMPTCHYLTDALVNGECLKKANRAQLRFNLGGNIEVRDLTLQGSNFTADCAENHQMCNDSFREGDHNINVWGSDTVLIDNVHFKNAWGDGADASPGYLAGGEAIEARNVTIQNSTVETAGRHGFSCTGCQNFVVRDNTIANVGSASIAIEQEVPPLPIDITAERNTFSKMGFFAIYITPQKAPQGGPSATMGPIVIQENTMTDPPAVSSGYAMTLNSSDPSGPAPPSVLVANNYVLGKFGGIQVGVTPLATVRGNTVELGPPCCGAIGINFVHDPVSVVGSGSITGNTVLYALQPFDYAASPTVTVCGNRTTETGGYDQPAPCP